MRFTLFALLGPLILPQPHQFAAFNSLTSTVTLTEAADVVVAFHVAATIDSVSSYSVTIDGVVDSDILIFPSAGRTSYDGLVGPLAKGRHAIAIAPSSHWKIRPPQATDLRIRIVDSRDNDRDAIRHAPGLWMRPDTIGQETDLPLLLYVERLGTAVQYSAIFSNEDGGTATRALLARWGRTTDIEWLYRTNLETGAPLNEKYQAANHDERPFGGVHRGRHPLLLVATKNNVFADAGRSAVLVRMLPREVDLTNRTRESVMDSEPWIYRVMQRELVAEGKLAGTDAPLSDMTKVHDPREYVYLEARLMLEQSAASAAALVSDGKVFTSDGGKDDLWIARNGWIRTAVSVGREPLTALRWTCRAQTTPSPGTAIPACQIGATRAFRLRDDMTVGTNLIAPRDIRLSPGESADIPLLSDARR